ncbi:peptidase M3 [Pseudomonas putida JB]|jgi:oligopeptidase A|uniref:Peptidase M3 n=1 Tax=Pseudomonas putida S12 TaxID=1215087 RepID=A0AA34WR10_PSEPU|nr:MULTISPECIES: M3 family metallopeptidase [Pseudomonas]AJA13447.1 peptidase M3 [Pseudomonas putida S12]AOX06920.1 peptidase M3 [Pseudomonas putida JB]PWY46442.1 peptidase M3 [Pseudomonas sp. RW405]TFF53805.1 peptidase M3 [Pseudomonas putida]TFW39244.1 peptidase M3 [Pseudomonas putida]
MDNPLLQNSHIPVDYSSITLENMQAAFDHVLLAHEKGVERIIIDQRAMPTWDDMVLAVDGLDSRLLAVLYGASPLVGRNMDWANAITDVYGRATARFEQKFANSGLHDLYERLAKSDIGKQLDAGKRATLRWHLDKFVASGALLDTAGKARLADLQAQIGTARKAFRSNIYRPGLSITDEAELSGIPQRVRDELAARAKEAGKQGWLIACDTVTTSEVLKHADSRQLRERVYRAFHARGVSHDPQQDNRSHLQRLAQLLEEKALLLGFPSHLEQSLQVKSAGSVAHVCGFLHDLADHVRPAMLQWRSQVEGRAAEQGLGKPQPWDFEYLQRASRSEFPTAALRDYFPLNTVVSALQQLAQKLFGVVLQPKALAAWDDSVQPFEVWQDSAFIGFLYLDAVQHAGKQPDAVFTTYVRNRRVDAEGIYHAASVVVFSDVPQAPPGFQPLLDHLSLRKLFHEFGHALHHLLVRTTNHVMSNVTELGTDGVELFGKLFERWVWDADYLVAISAHARDGSQLTRKQADKCLQQLRQQGVEEIARHLSLALFDMDLHATPNDGRSFEQRLGNARERCGYWPLADFEHPAHAFDHLVDGYDAGYYAYLWSDVHAFDLFTRFEAEGLLNRATGRALQEALFAPGASRPLREGIEAFLGRQSNQAAYLRWHGLK